MKILPKTIKARINQLAHRRAQQYALMVRDSTLSKLQGMAEAGATFEALCAAIETSTGAAVHDPE
jgi:predicted ribonuclease YlaK